MCTPLDRKGRDWSKGNCYYVTLQFIQDSAGLIGKKPLLPDGSVVLLVHGKIEPVAGKAIKHAWIEINEDVVLDHANNYGWVDSKEKYYQLHKATPARKFSREEADAIISHLKAENGELFIGFWGDLNDEQIAECRKAYNPEKSVFSADTNFTDPSDESNQSNLVIAAKDSSASVVPPSST